MRLAALLLTIFSVVSGAPVEVHIEPSSRVSSVGKILDVEVRAALPDGILGWGLDITWNPMVLSVIATEIGPSWFPTSAFDGDNLAGVAFPDPVSGSDVLLATIHFLSIGSGSTLLSPSITVGDASEGFALSTIGFADVEFTNATISIGDVPEPGYGVVIGFSVFCFWFARDWYRRRRQGY